MTFQPKSPAEMRKLAEAATPGPWDASGSGFTDWNYAECSYSMEFISNGGPDGFDDAMDARNVAYITAANPAQILHDADLIDSLTKEVEGLREALKRAEDFIDGVREDLHSQRSADWYPEGVHDAATSMSESMRLIGNRCADFDALSTSGRAG